MNTIVKEGLRFAAWAGASIFGGVIAVRVHDKVVKALVDEKKEKIAAWMEKDSNKELFAFLGALPVSGWEDEEDEEKLNEYLSCIKIINTNRFNMQSIIKRKKAEETTDEKPAE
jgi:hypothetical protein